jgi:hypothetical protein
MSYSNIARERLIWKQVSLAADAINAFVDWLGFDPASKTRASAPFFLAAKASACLILRRSSPASRT